MIRMAIRTEVIVKEYEDILTRMFDEFILHSIERIASIFKLKLGGGAGVIELKTDVEKVTDALDGEWNRTLEKNEKKINNVVDRSYKAGAKKGREQLGKLQIVVGELTPLDRRAIGEIRARNMMYVKGFYEDAKVKMTNATIEGIQMGEGIPDIANRIYQSCEVSMKRAKTIARTEVSYGYNTACANKYYSAGVEYFEVLLGSKPCPICKTIAANNPYKLGIDPIPPYHPNCTCGIAPVFDATAYEKKMKHEVVSIEDAKRIIEFWEKYGTNSTKNETMWTIDTNGQFFKENTSGKTHSVRFSGSDIVREGLTIHNHPNYGNCFSDADLISDYVFDTRGVVVTAPKFGNNVFISDVRRSGLRGGKEFEDQFKVEYDQLWKEYIKADERYPSIWDAKSEKEFLKVKNQIARDASVKTVEHLAKKYDFYFEKTTIDELKKKISEMEAKK